MRTTPAWMAACTMPFSPMMRVSVDAISPRNLPFSITVPLNVYFPSISDPSSMNAVRSLVLTGRLPVFFHSIRQPSATSVVAAAITARTAGGERGLFIEEIDLLARRLVLDLHDVAV